MSDSVGAAAGAAGASRKRGRGEGEGEAAEGFLCCPLDGVKFNLGDRKPMRTFCCDKVMCVECWTSACRQQAPRCPFCRSLDTITKAYLSKQLLFMLILEFRGKAYVAEFSILQFGVSVNISILQSCVMIFCFLSLLCFGFCAGESNHVGPVMWTDTQCPLCPFVTKMHVAHCHCAEFMQTCIHFVGIQCALQ